MGTTTTTTPQRTVSQPRAHVLPLQPHVCAAPHAAHPSTASVRAARPHSSSVQASKPMQTRSGLLLHRRTTCSHRPEATYR